MFLKNGAVFMQFHPVAYTVKLKIELSMTNLITRISKESINERMGTTSTSHGQSRFTFGTHGTLNKDVPMDVFSEPNHTATISTQKHISGEPQPVNMNHIYTKREVTVQVSDPNDVHDVSQSERASSSRGSKEHTEYNTFGNPPDDEIPMWRR